MRLRRRGTLSSSASQSFTRVPGLPPGLHRQGQPSASVLVGWTSPLPASHGSRAGGVQPRSVVGGLWPGGSGADEVAFHSYAYPAPKGFAEAQNAPSSAHWHFAGQSANVPSDDPDEFGPSSLRNNDEAPEVAEIARKPRPWSQTWLSQGPALRLCSAAKEELGKIEPWQARTASSPGCVHRALWNETPTEPIHRPLSRPRLANTNGAAHLVF